MNNLTYSLSDINGYEIIDFLNSQFDEGEYDDTMIFYQSFEFVNQCIEHATVYKLYFGISWNNWGTPMQLSGKICITENKVDAYFDELLSSDCSEITENLLESWLPNHIFKSNNREQYYNCVDDARDDLIMLYVVNISVEERYKITNKIIQNLEYSKQFIK